MVSTNNRIRKITAAGTISTVAGGRTGIGTIGDGGPALAASLNQPVGVAVDSAGNLYIAEYFGSSVRKVSADGTITTVAGCGGLTSDCAMTYYRTDAIGDGGPAAGALVYGPTGVAVDSAGNLYIADKLNNRIRKVPSGGIINTVAGSAISSYAGDGGAATKAGLNNPVGVAVDASGNICIDDAGEYRIRVVTTDGIINTIARNGAGGPQFTAAPSGVPATSTSLGQTYAISLGPGGSVYVADYFSGIRVLKPNTPPAVAPAIASKGVVSASAFGTTSTVAPGSLIEIYGTNLATTTRGWSGSDFNGSNAPTSLSGTSATVGGQSAFIAYVSPTQNNIQVPSNVAADRNRWWLPRPPAAAAALTP